MSGKEEESSFFLEEPDNIPARGEMNENEDDLPARESAHGARDGPDFAHGPHHGLDAAKVRWPDPQIGSSRTRQYDQGTIIQDIDTEIERGQGCTDQAAEIS